MNQQQPRPKDTVDEETIEDNLKKMDYPASEDIMRQNRQVEVNQLENVDKQAFTEKQMKEQGK